MNLLKEIFDHEVFPAMGCTEPISCAFASAVAAEKLGQAVEKLTLIVDAGTYKNGAAVTVPQSGGEKGNVIAAAMGAVIADSSAKLEVLKNVTPEVLEGARKLVASGSIAYKCSEKSHGFRVEVHAEGGGKVVRCVVSDGHANVTHLEKDGEVIVDKKRSSAGSKKTYRDVLKSMKLEDVIREATKLDDETRKYIQRGIDMNLAISEKGVAIKRTAYQLEQMRKEGILKEDLFYNVKFRVASAVDARMAGLAEPVMTSGGSGNQGTLAILVPYLVGVDRKVPIEKIYESIAISHAVNSYIKCFIGELSVICGCAIAASISAAIALVYQKVGIDMQKITFAIDNVIGDLCGLICDGAKPGCSMKTVSGADTAIRSAFMALEGYGLSTDDGVLGSSPEASIKNLSLITLGMFRVDPTIVKILEDKASGHGLA